MTFFSRLVASMLVLTAVRCTIVHIMFYFTKRHSLFSVIIIYDTSTTFIRYSYFKHLFYSFTLTFDYLLNVEYLGQQKKKVEKLILKHKESNKYVEFNLE